MISLALGRPCAISDASCVNEEAKNVWIDDLDDEAAALVSAQPLDNPTPSVVSFLIYRLAKLIGKIQEKCFALERASYDVVLGIDKDLVAWSEDLPSYFRIDSPDASLDEALPFLKWHRLYLHTSFHFARIMLHRPFLLRESITDRFRPSHHACMSSALADLKIRLQTINNTVAENVRWAFGAHNLFNSAMILGIIAVRGPHLAQTGAILEDLEAYCESLQRDPWLNEFGMAELKVIELCVFKTRTLRNGSISTLATGPLAEEAVANSANPQDAGRIRGFGGLSSPAGSTDISSVYWPTIWEDSQFPYPGAADFGVWEQMITDIAEERYTYP